MNETFSVPQRAPDYADVFSGPLAHPDMSARDLLRLSISKTPRWFHALFGVRNAVAGLFGLKTEIEGRPDGPAVNFLDNMPIIEDADHAYVSGLSDSHLDFLIKVEKTKAHANEAAKVSFTTQIWFNKTFGKAYLIAVLPVHKAIIRHFIRTLGKSA